jgi:hypothetical protein
MLGFVTARDRKCGSIILHGPQVSEVKKPIASLEAVMIALNSSMVVGILRFGGGFVAAEVGFTGFVVREVPCGGNPVPFGNPVPSILPSMRGRSVCPNGVLRKSSGSDEICPGMVLPTKNYLIR